ncbi:hypothetical protein [Marinicella rhabdoformis]|uniref:hypothetical protein n=1 Tax=Marinicella rhabdoformis TaxID=2580566 RepID=UPI0012AEC793|nr:hypothetical protein [Marinicella rhabdoformis]
MSPRVSVNRLLNDGDSRRKLLLKASRSGHPQLQTLANRLKTLEDLTPYRLRVDYLPKQVVKTKRPNARNVGLALFALCNMGLIVSSVVVYEEIISSRKNVQQSKLEN